MINKASLFAGEGWLSCSLRGEFICIIHYISAFSAIFYKFFLRIPIFLRTFAPISNVEFKSERNMEEKKYHIDESKIAGDKVCEPSPVYASVASESVSHHMIDSGIEQKDEIPVLKNHFSYEGLLDSLDYSETIKDDSSKWESVDAFNERLYEEFPWLR